VSTKVANPAPLGLLGFGMTTILLNLHNANLIPLSIVIIAMGFALGGLAQIIAGIFEFRNGNTFAGTAFTAYGTFWWSLVVIWTLAPEGMTADKVSMGYYLSIWGVFTAFMFIGTLKHNRITQFVFGSLTLLFFLLALGDFTLIPEITITAGVVGLLCGASAVYSAVGQLVNGEFGQPLFPL
jgi:succinate-acetate transporter protein